ncbi:hypothetical protein DYI25_07670 [Mesobacillus boroniphilus]|uniref:Uncharacterized protein n=1 Tax=Mesobacillus boroniphilus TaxID=308892 RepID=A0A944CJH4_9BACI|nr:hypothetical protein [Mesobacillus boroniphilus]MBS8264311.1 hypothetical protein [Mesobacillus boroniphilus]
MKRKNVLLLLVFIIILTGGMVYWFYLAPPATFPDKEKIKDTLMNRHNRINIAEIQDSIFLDDEHVYIPFTTKTESHGISLWEWKKHEWQLTSLSTGNMPLIWKIEPDDPATHYIMWNLHPKNNLDYLTFYLIKERGYSVTEGKHQYDPGVQMDFRAEVEEQSYGYSPIPPEWQEYVEAENQQMEAMKPDPFFAGFFPPTQYYFGWQSISKNGTIEYPSYPDNNGFGSGGQSTEDLRFLNENEVYQK